MNKTTLLVSGYLGSPEDIFGNKCCGIELWYGAGIDIELWRWVGRSEMRLSILRQISFIPDPL